MFLLRLISNLCVVFVFLPKIIESSCISDDIIVFPESFNASRLPTAESRFGVSENVIELSRAAREFSLDLIKHLSQTMTSNTTNIIVSPLSIWSLLLFLVEGASDETYEQLINVLRIPKNLTKIGATFKDFELNFKENTTAFGLDQAQILFYDINRPPDNEFQEKLEYAYGADFYPVDFHDLNKTVHEINNYVKMKAREKVDRILELCDINVSFLVPISAVSFQRHLENSFEESMESLPFYNEYGGFIDNIPYSIIKGNVHEVGTKIIELKYGNDSNLSMLIFLPEKNLPIRGLIDKLEYSHLDSVFLITNLIETSNEADVHLPRFAISSNHKLDRVLQDMGLTDLFSGTPSFSKITPHKANISLFHKAVINVHETIPSNGTLTNSESFSLANVHIVNRPFAFVIVERTTQSILLSGVVQDPRNDGI